MYMWGRKAITMKVPIADSFHGLSDCCHAPVTFHDTTLCCKKCWNAVVEILDIPQKLHDAIFAWVNGKIDHAALKKVQIEYGY